MKGAYAHYALAQEIARVAPKRAAAALAAGIAALYGRIGRADLEAVGANLQCVRGPYAELRALRQDTRRLIRNYARYLVDLLYCGDFTPDRIRRQVDLGGIDRLEEALAKGRGVILASAHVGHWELGGMALSRLGYRVAGIALPHRDPRIDRIFTERRRQCGLETIPLGASLRRAFGVLRKNGVLALNADRLFGDGGMPVRFLGREVHFPKGPARLRWATGAEIVPAFFLMESRERYRLEIQEPIRRTTEEEILQDFAARCETVIRRAPLQWFVFQKFWETPLWPA